MNTIVINSIRFVLFVFAQGLILNNLEFGWGAMPMLYPLFILLLPVDTKPVVLMLIAFVFGLAIDSISNTFGLHCSAAVVLAFFRPIIFSAYSSKETMESVEYTNVYNMGASWFLYNFGTLLLIHHTWFFVIESFKLNDFLIILRKVALSVPLSYLLSLLIQFIFLSKKTVVR
jgi:hypothetical protein